MLVELGVVEQRHAAVLEVLEGATVTDVARRCGVSRQTVHRWLRRYARAGLPGLVDHSSKPMSCPHQMPPEVEAAIVGMRREHPGWGPRTIGYQLARTGVDPVPGRSSIYRALVRHGLIDPQARRRERSDYRRWERSRAMELWQLDVTGGVRLVDGSRLQLLTGIDDHSRFCVSARVVVRATAKPVCAFAEAMRTHGVPEQVLTDNGKVFTGRFGPGVGEVLFDRICRENGIRHLLTAPRSPTTTGKVERFHKTLKREFLEGKTFDSIVDAQAAIDEWVQHYNPDRPHQGIGMVPPFERFRLVVADSLVPAEPPPPTTEPIVTGPDVQLVARKVTATGMISLERFRYLVGRWPAGETVQVTLREGLVEISHRGVLVATHAHRYRPGASPTPRVQQRQRQRGATVGVPVVRKVDGSGSISFAGHAYRVGNAYKRMTAVVAIVAGTVQISIDGQLVRTHPIRHDRSKEHGAFANPTGKPDRINAAPTRQLPQAV